MQTYIFLAYKLTVCFFLQCTKQHERILNKQSNTLTPNIFNVINPIINIFFIRYLQPRYRSFIARKESCDCSLPRNALSKFCNYLFIKLFSIKKLNIYIYSHDIFIYSYDISIYSFIIFIHSCYILSYLYYTYTYIHIFIWYIHIVILYIHIVIL